MNIVSPILPKVNTPSWEWDERRFELEIPNLVPNPTQMVKDAGNAIVELFTGHILAKDSKEAAKPVIGGKTELRFTKKTAEEEQVEKNKRIVDRQKAVAQQQAEVRSKQSQKKAKEQLIENVNKTIGGITNLSYEGIVDENGALRIDVQAYYEKANSQLDEKELQAKRQNQIAQVTRGKTGFMGENELLKGGENFGHFTKAPG